MYLFPYIGLLLVCIYIGSLIYYILGNLIIIDGQKSHHLNSVSIIIAVKNGEKSLPNILSDLENQNYEGESEYIIVDDESTPLIIKLLMSLIFSYCDLRVSAFPMKFKFS